MAENYLHGARVIDVDGGITGVQSVRTGIIGLIGTAPSADPLKYPYDEPVLVTAGSTAITDLGPDGTLADALEDIFDQIGAVVILVRVEEGDTLAQTMANISGSSIALTGVHAFKKAKSAVGYKPKQLIATGFTSQRPVDGVKTVAVKTGGANYPASKSFVLKATGDGFGFKGRALSNAAGAIYTVVIDNPGSGFSDAPEIAFVTAPATGTGATFEATLATVANPVVAEMLGVADRLRAMIHKDGPNTTNEAAIQDRNDWGSRRVYLVDPMVKVQDSDGAIISRPMSARSAGLVAKRHFEKGFWWSPSNQVIAGVVGVARHIDFEVDDENSESNLLNENGIATVINHKGFKLWGNETCSSDPKWKFFNVVVVADTIAESVVDATIDALDRPINANTVTEIVESVNDYLRYLTAIGAILGGKAWIDRSLNTAGQLSLGKLRVEFDYEPPAPLQTLTFGARRNTAYYDVLLDDIAREVQLLAA